MFLSHILDHIPDFPKPGQICSDTESLLAKPFKKTSTRACKSDIFAQEVKKGGIDFVFVLGTLWFR